MNILIAKLKSRQSEFLKVMSSSGVIWEFPDIANSVDYSPAYKLEDVQWFKLDNFTSRSFANGIIEDGFDSTTYNQIAKEQYSTISYLCGKQDKNYYFQRVTPSLFLSKKWFTISDAPVLESEKPIIILNPIPDAIFDKNANILYFRDISKIKPMFDGIESLFREATQEEVETFFENDFIKIGEGYLLESVGTLNRKRIALAIETYNKFSDPEKKEIIKYTKEYCPDVPIEGDSFSIEAEEHLKQVCFGIEQRYYTTRIGHEKRLANSVLALRGS